MSQSLRRSVSQHYNHRQQQRTNSSLTRSSSFKMLRRVYHRMCASCGQSHEKEDNHLYDYPIEVEEELMCQVCLQPLVDPVDTPCGHTFCSACARRQIRLHKACPIDRQRLTEEDIRIASNLVRNILDKLNVVCPNTAYCDATMPRSSMERHLKHLCPGTYTRCPRNALGCTFVGPRNQLTEHLWGCVYGNDVDPITGIKLEVVEDVRCLVEIPKGANDLGLNVTICERTGALVIQDVYHNGNGYKDGRLRRGDQILSIDGQKFSNKSIAQARLALSTTRPLVAIVVLRSNSFEFKMPGYDKLPQVEEVELVRDEDRPLGINIYTLKNHPGIYINNIESGSLAESCDRLLVGDRILEANGYNIRHANIDEAAARMDEAYGPVRLLVAHRMVRRSPSSSDHSSSSGRFSANRVYEEVKQRTGYRVGALKCVILKKDSHESFGMSVSGGIGSNDGDIPIYVSGIRPDSIVDKCSDIQRGDIILSVSDISLIDKTHSEAVQLMKSVSHASLIRLEMIQGDNLCDDDDGCLSPEWEEWMDDYRTGRSSPIEMNITLPRHSNDSLGFSVVGGVDSRRGDSPIYIKGIASRGIAADDGRLKSRDQILRVNGVSVDGMRQDEVVRLIKAFSGDITLTVVPHHYTNV